MELGRKHSTANFLRIKIWSQYYPILKLWKPFCHCPKKRSQLIGKARKVLPGGAWVPGSRAHLGPSHSLILRLSLSCCMGFSISLHRLQSAKCCLNDSAFTRKCLISVSETLLNVFPKELSGNFTGLFGGRRKVYQYWVSKSNRNANL